MKNDLQNTRTYDWEQIQMRSNFGFHLITQTFRMAGLWVFSTQTVGPRGGRLRR